MTAAPEITLFHAPNSRSTGIAILLEELGAPYTLHAVNMKAGEQRQPAYLAINPMGKVPAVRVGEALVTEQAALFIYLPDLFPAAALAPALDDPDRGPYLRWIVFHAACFEPAVIDHYLKREAAPMGMSPYGNYDTVLKTLGDQLARGPYLLGDRFSAADILWGTALGWVTAFKLVPETPEIMAYIERVKARPAIAKVRAMDAALAAAQSGG